MKKIIALSMLTASMLCVGAHAQTAEGTAQTPSTTDAAPMKSSKHKMKHHAADSKKSLKTTPDNTSGNNSGQSGTSREQMPGSGGSGGGV